MLFATIALALTAPSEPPERHAWDDCLLAYAQTESFGGKTAVSIAVEAVGVCAAERQLYVKALVRQFQATATPGNSALDQAVAKFEVDRKAALRRVIAFVLRNRRA